MHSEVFDSFWDHVDEFDRIDYDVYQAWMGVWKYYIYIHTSPDCVMRNLEEMRLLKRYSDVYLEDVEFEATTTISNSFASSLFPLILLILFN